MGQFNNLVKRSDEFVKKLDGWLDIATLNSKGLLLELNKQQLSISKTSTGQTITPAYSPNYAAQKGFSNPDLKDTGDFYAAMFFSVQAGKYLISSTDFKTALLVNKYSAAIFGIFNKSLAQVITTEELSKLYIKNVL